MKNKSLALLLVLPALALFSSFRPYPRLSALLFRRVPASTAAPASFSRGHSHNDYEQSRPLTDALAAGVLSVEADIWLAQGEIQVSHLGWFFNGSLRDLYLDPLQALANRQGAVPIANPPFLLWLDIKDDNPALLPALHDLLSRYPMIPDRQVSVILSGNPMQKQTYCHRYPRDGVLHDSGRAIEQDAPLAEGDPWQWYSLNWFKYLEWDGEGEIPVQEARKLALLVATVHRQGRRLRFWGAPDHPGIWQASVEAGVDLISTNNLPGFSDFTLRP